MGVHVKSGWRAAMWCTVMVGAACGGDTDTGATLGGQSGTGAMMGGEPGATMGGGGATSDEGMGGAGEGMGGSGGMAPGGGGDGDAVLPPGDSPLPPTDDYAAPGPFADALMETNVGPGGGYTLFRPGDSLGRDGFLHPIVTWGNGISTTPQTYASTLTLVATHGFVIIAANDTQAEEPALAAGLEWLIEQQSGTGALAGKLDVTREATIGYSWGGGAAIDTAHRPNVVATASLHGMPPRRDDAFTSMHAPLLLFTSTGDGFVTADEYVTPNYEMSLVQTFYATLDDPNAGHLYPADEGGVACIAATLGTCQSAALERAPLIAWLRLWVFGDMGGRHFFYGDDCTLCQSPWTDPQRKHWP